MTHFTTLLVIGGLEWLIILIIIAPIIGIVMYVIKENERTPNSITGQSAAPIQHQLSVNSQTASITPSVNFNKNIEALKEYKKLLDAGVITQEEYDQQKNKILS